jgi:hypothetical protein
MFISILCYILMLSPEKMAKKKAKRRKPIQHEAQPKKKMCHHISGLFIRNETGCGGASPAAGRGMLLRCAAVRPTCSCVRCWRF